jgi:hypothetical protein
MEFELIPRIGTDNAAKATNEKLAEPPALTHAP